VSGKRWDIGLLSDSEVIRRVRAGKTRDYQTLVKRYQESVFALAYRILGRREEAEDATQDTFINAYRSLDSHNAGAAFWPWLRRIAINCCLRKIPREFPVEEVEENAQESCVGSVEKQVLRKCQTETVQKIISGLPENYRTPLVLRYQEDLSIAEIAQVLDESPGTIRVRLHRALKMLADRLVIDNEM
jgi:RNA polymerase sigma-70 factor, ECF subfamily